MSNNPRELDLRGLPIIERHPMVYDAWEALEEEEALRIINDHDPRPLFYHFEGGLKGKFNWEYEEAGPAWVVRVKKLKTPDPDLGDVTRRVEDALSEVRPYLQADGGDVALVDIDVVKRAVRVKLTGACSGCPSAQMTLKAGVEKAIKKHAPEMKRVEEVV